MQRVKDPVLSTEAAWVTAVVWNQSLAQDLLHDMDEAKKKKKKKKKRGYHNGLGG